MQQQFEISKKEFLQNSWTFLQTPQTNSNIFQGHTENRTIFSGTEKISFLPDNSFLVNDIKYGVWVLNAEQTFITITQTPQKEYSCCGIGQTIMQREIRKLNENTLYVNHGYYKYIDNIYNLKKSKY